MKIRNRDSPTMAARNGLAIDNARQAGITYRGKKMYLGVQMLSLERPEVMAAQTVREDYKITVKKKGRYKDVNRTRFVKVIRVTDTALADAPRGHHTITCPCWGVAGHWRTYKSGKQIWIEPYRKGKQRANPAVYQPKEYEYPKEGD